MDRNIKLLALFNFFTDLRFHSAVLILYFVQVTGSFTLAMSLFATVMISAALFEVPTGIFSDMIGRKKTIIFGAISAFLYSLFYAVGQIYLLLFIGAILEGLSRAWYSGNNEALLYDSLVASGKKDSYGKYLGKLSSMFQVALAIGALIGSIIAYWSFPIIMWLSVLPQLICVVIAFCLTEPAIINRQSSNIYSHFRQAISLIIHNKVLRLVSLQDIISFGINEATFDFRSAFIATIWPIWAIGISKLLSYVGAAVSFWTSGRVIKKFGEQTVLLYSRIYGRIIGIFSYAFPTVASPVLLSSTSLLYGTVSVATNSLLQQHFTQSQRVTAASIVSLVGSLFFGIFSICLGYIADRTNPATSLLLAEICSASTIYITWKLLQNTKQVRKSNN